MIKSQLTSKFHGIDLTILYNYYPLHPGSADKYGAPLTPPEPEEIEITSIIHKDEDIIDLFEEDSIEILVNLVFEAREEVNKYEEEGELEFDEYE